MIVGNDVRTLLRGQSGGREENAQQSQSGDEQQAHWQGNRYGGRTTQAAILGTSIIAVRKENGNTTSH
jgi:hypothetical protein